MVMIPSNPHQPMAIVPWWCGMPARMVQASSTNTPLLTWHWCWVHWFCTQSEWWNQLMFFFRFVLPIDEWHWDHSESPELRTHIVCQPPCLGLIFYKHFGNRNRHAMDRYCIPAASASSVAVFLQYISPTNDPTSWNPNDFSAQIPPLVGYQLLHQSISILSVKSQVSWNHWTLRQWLRREDLLLRPRLLPQLQAIRATDLHHHPAAVQRGLGGAKTEKNPRVMRSSKIWSWYSWWIYMELSCCSL